MNKHTHILLGASLLCLCALPAQAQDKPSNWKLDKDAVKQHLERKYAAKDVMVTEDPAASDGIQRHVYVRQGLPLAGIGPIAHPQNDIPAERYPTPGSMGVLGSMAASGRIADVDTDQRALAFAKRLLADEADALGVDPALTLREINLAHSHISGQGEIIYMTYQYTLQDIPLAGARAVVVIGADGNVRDMQIPVPIITAAMQDAANQPVMPPEQAQAAVQTQDQLDPARVELAEPILILKPPYRCWKVFVRSEADANMGEYVLVDASTGDIVNRISANRGGY